MPKPHSVNNTKPSSAIYLLYSGLLLSIVVFVLQTWAPYIARNNPYYGVYTFIEDVGMWSGFVVLNVGIGSIVHYFREKSKARQGEEALYGQTVFWTTVVISVPLVIFNLIP